MKRMKYQFSVRLRNLLAICFLLALISCSSKKSESNKAMQTFKDSIARSEGSKAIGCINFDISENQFKKEISLFFLSIKQTDTIVGSYCYRIGSFYLNENNVYSYFNKDSLVGLDFFDEYLVYSDFGYPPYYIKEGPQNVYINDDYNSLIEIFSQKYGTPDVKKEFFSDDEWTRLPVDSEIRDLTLWSIGRKTIKIRYSKGHESYGDKPEGDGIYIRLYISISDENIRNRILQGYTDKFEIESQKNDIIQKAMNEKTIKAL